MHAYSKNTNNNLSHEGAYYLYCTVVIASQ